MFRYKESDFLMARKSKVARCSGAGEDRLSSLPDEILINNILSRLPMREAQRTSILAPSWRYLWLYVPGLDLDGSQKVGPSPPETKGTFLYPYERLEKGSSQYAEWVDRVIDGYRGTAALRHFRVIFRLGSSFARKIDSWLEFSLRQGVEVLEIDCGWKDNEIMYNPYLSIEPTRFPSIRLLKSLTLRAVRISSDSLARLLLACEFLERLQLAGLGGLTHVKVTGPVSRLKHIHIDSCSYYVQSNLKSISIHAPTPDLVSFRCPPNVKTTVHIEHAPRLVDLRMVLPSGDNQDITLHPLFRYHSQLEALHLVPSVNELFTNMDRLHDLPVLGRLKHLKWTKVDCIHKRPEAHWVASLIKKAPLLRHLTLEVRPRRWTVPDTVPSNYRAMKLREELDKMHLQLPPVIEISGFRGWKMDHKLVLHLIEDSPSLEKLIIDCRDPEQRGGCTFTPYECSEKTIKKCKKAAKEAFEPQLPSKAKLVII